MQADTLAHIVWIMEGDLAEPKWPDFDIKELINTASGGKGISDRRRDRKPKSKV
jgi:hypothetical protein